MPPGCGGAFLILIAAAGVLVWTLVAWGATHVSATSASRFPQQLGWDYYVLVSALWGVAIGVTGIVLALRSQRTGSGDPVVLLLFWDLGVLLAIAWPAQAMALAAVYAARAGRHRPRHRLGALVAGALLLTGGCQWGSNVHAGQELHTPGQVSVAALRGNWHNVTGEGLLELGSDGRFTARDVPAALGWGNLGSARVNAVGTWILVTDEASPTVALTIASDASTPGLSAIAHLDVRAFGSSLVLCSWRDDPDDACDSGFHR